MIMKQDSYKLGEDFCIFGGILRYAEKINLFESGGGGE